MNKITPLLYSLFCLISNNSNADLPKDFVYLRTIEPTIQQDIRYATSHNFIGKPIQGYEAAECILTRPAALALARVQKELQKISLSLKVYDCYRPQQAVDEFIRWSQQLKLQQMKAEFYPRVNKADFFKLGYVAAKSGHSRGSTVDVTLVATPTHYKHGAYYPPKQLVCFAPAKQRFADNSIEMGSSFDCMDEVAHNDYRFISSTAWNNRLLLKSLLQKQGFIAYQAEWWHFTLKPEPYPHTYFNFPVRVKP